MATIARLSWDPAGDPLPPRLDGAAPPHAAAAGDVMLIDAEGGEAGSTGGEGGWRGAGQRATLILPPRFAPKLGWCGGGAADGEDGRQSFASEGMYHLVRRSLCEWVRLNR